MSRNDENNYTLRPLTIDDAEEYNALLRYAFQVTEQELAETGWKDDEITQSKFPVLQRADVLGCFNGDDLIAQFAVYPLDMNIYGVKYSVGFVTSVCTYHRTWNYEKTDDSEPYTNERCSQIICFAVSIFNSIIPWSWLGNYL